MGETNFGPSSDIIGYTGNLFSDGEIIIHPRNGKICFPVLDSSRYFPARAMYERLLK